MLVSLKCIKRNHIHIRKTKSNHFHKIYSSIPKVKCAITNKVDGLDNSLIMHILNFKKLIMHNITVYFSTYRYSQNIQY